VVSFTPRPLYPLGNRPCTHWAGGCVGPRVCLEDVERRKILNLPGLIPRPFGPWPVAVPTELTRFPGDWGRRIINCLLLVEGVLSESKILITLFLVMTPCSLLCGINASDLKAKAPGSFEKQVTSYESTRRRDPCDT
jgi:hypothetical protein